MNQIKQKHENNSELIEYINKSLKLIQEVNKKNIDKIL